MGHLYLAGIIMDACRLAAIRHGNSRAVTLHSLKIGGACYESCTADRGKLYSHSLPCRWEDLWPLTPMLMTHVAMSSSTYRQCFRVVSTLHE